MTEQRKVTGGWSERWREHRRGRRQVALEREYFEWQRERSADDAAWTACDHLNASTHASAYQTEGLGFSGGLGGDGGGC